MVGVVVQQAGCAEWVERRHAGARHQRLRVGQPVDDPLRPQALGGQREVGRPAVRRTRRELVALDVTGGAVEVLRREHGQRRVQLVLRQIRLHRLGERIVRVVERREVGDQPVALLRRHAVARHAHPQPRTDGRRFMEEGEQPVGLHLAALAEQVGRREAGRQRGRVGGVAALEPFQPVGHPLHHRAAVAFDDVAALAVHLPYQVLALLDAQVARRARHHEGVCRIDLHEAGERGHHRLHLLVGEAEVRHAALQ